MIALTDDELVAVALGAGIEWPGALPTVAGEEQALLTASHRGMRSLQVRDLVRFAGDGFQVSADLMAQLGPALAGSVKQVISLTDAEGALKPGTFAFVLHEDAASESQVVETLTSEGVHAFDGTDTEAWAALVRVMAELAQTGRLSEIDAAATSEDGVSILKPHADGSASGVLISRGGARHVSLSVEGSLSIGDAATVEDSL